MSEELRRAAKALRLVKALQAEFEGLSLAALRPGTAEALGALADLARDMPEAVWGSLAERAGCKPPSRQTVAVVIVMLETEADVLRERAA